jgi:hypothetical protein
MKPSPQDNFALRKELPFVVAINNKANGHSLLLTFRLRSGEDRSFVLNTEVVVRLFRMIYLTAIEGGWIAPDFNITGGIPTKL